MNRQSIFSAAMVLHSSLVFVGSLVLVGSLANPTAADLMVELGSAQAVLAPGSGTTTASFDITFRNQSLTDPALFAAYTLFLDIGPLGAGLPTGVTFDSPAATYTAGGPLGGSGTVNLLMPAFGDLGLGQFQTDNGMIGPDVSVVILTINLEIDRTVAIPGVHDIILSAAGQNSIDSINPIMGDLPISQPFTVNGGSLTLTAIPEPSVFLFGCMATVCACWGWWVRGGCLLRGPRVPLL